MEHDSHLRTDNSSMRRETKISLHIFNQLIANTCTKIIRWRKNSLLPGGAHTDTDLNWSRDLADGAKTTAQIKHGQELRTSWPLHEGGQWWLQARQQEKKKVKSECTIVWGSKDTIKKTQTAQRLGWFCLLILQYHGDLHLDYIKNYYALKLRQQLGSWHRA